MDAHEKRPSNDKRMNEQIKIYSIDGMFWCIIYMKAKIKPSTLSFPKSQ